MRAAARAALAAAARAAPRVPARDGGRHRLASVAPPRAEPTRHPSPLSVSLPPFRLPPGEVHVWWLPEGDTDAAARLAAECEASGLVPPGEADAARAAAPADASRALLSRALVRWVLAKYAGTPAGELEFERGPAGKPALAARGGDPGSPLPPPPPEFNLTHTPGLLGVAVSPPGLAVGLDAEAAGRAPRGGCLRVARRHFARADVAALESLPAGPARDAEFVRLWTLKEAYVKATGHGIRAGGLASAPLALREGATAAAALEAAVPGLRRAPNPRLVTWEGEGRGEWRFALLAPTAAHVAALCVRARAPGSSPDAPLPPFRVRAWRAAPLGADGELGASAAALAVSEG